MGALPGPNDPNTFAAILGDPTRRSIYLHVKQRGRAVTVNEIAEKFDLHRNAAKFHLDKLLDAGLLNAEFHRVNGRQGPGAGRPSKIYSPSDTEVSFSFPERHYDVLAGLLLKALTSGEDLEVVGRRFGRELAEAAEAEIGDCSDSLDCAHLALERLGFDPSVTRDADGKIWVTTQNCPFGKVAMDAPNHDVCKLDRAIIEGVLSGPSCPVVEVIEHASKAHGHDICIREVVVR